MDNQHICLEPLCETDEKGENLFSKHEIKDLSSEISQRILMVFDYLPDKEIAFLLETNINNVKSFIHDGNLPSTETLLGIQKVTGISIDWLLTGQGTKYINLARHISQVKNAVPTSNIFNTGRRKTEKLVLATSK